jgi:hypothetical protein
MGLTEKKGEKMNEEKLPRRIVILQRGWVMVGLWKQEGSQVTLTDAAVIRRWGTTRGLGEIAEEGPTNDTVLDPCPIVRFHELVVIATLDCQEEKWTEWRTMK